LLDGTFRIGFEDTLGGGDMDFDDVNLIVTANAELQVLVDTDGDGAWDFADACPLDASDDTDGDGVCDSDDACPVDMANDVDGDGICGSIDNCPAVANLDQLDADGDGTGDVCQVAGLHVDAAVPARAGQANTWMVTGAAPSAPLELLFGRVGGTTPIAGCPGLSIELTGPRLLAFGSADMDGTTALTFAVPMAARGNTMAVQAVDLATCTVSNVQATRMR
jgi:hypothetical protein